MRSWQCKISENISTVPAQDWNQIADPNSPFLTHEFLLGLETSGCVNREQSTWHPHHLLLYDKNRLIAALPFYIRYDSYGEYIFDHSWAQAYAQAGLDYYPKGTVAIPFTPVNGWRILRDPNYDFKVIVKTLTEKLIKIGQEKQLSSIHFLFLTDEERIVLEENGFITRISTQFHWHNRDYQNFDQYLADLKSARRKQIKKERQSIIDQGIVIYYLSGKQIQKKHMQAMYSFYRNTIAIKWGQPYLNWQWFEQIQERMSNNTLLTIAQDRNQNIVGATLSFFKGNKLAGRY